MRKRLNTIIGMVAVSLWMTTMIGCSNSNSPTTALDPFQPEIINNADAFQFQATGVDNVSTTVQYTWANTGTQATINHSSVITSGSAVVTLFDSAGTQVYQSGLVASANQASNVGIAGNWTVRVVLTDLVGTLNFSAQKL